jgi:hypothetical protein
MEHSAKQLSGHGVGFAIDFASGIEVDLRAAIAVAMMFPTLVQQYLP